MSIPLQRKWEFRAYLVQVGDEFGSDAKNLKCWEFLGILMDNFLKSKILTGQNCRGFSVAECEFFKISKKKIQIFMINPWGFDYETCHVLMNLGHIWRYQEIFNYKRYSSKPMIWMLDDGNIGQFFSYKNFDFLS